MTTNKRLVASWVAAVVVGLASVLTGCGRGSDDTEEITANIIEAINGGADCGASVDGVADDSWSTFCVAVVAQIGSDADLTYEDGYSLSPNEVGLAYYSEVGVVTADGTNQDLRLCFQAEGLLKGTPVLATAELDGFNIFDTGEDADCPGA